MRFIADLHLHSKYSRATSNQLDIKNLEKWAKVKGLNLLGTGDFTHPLWLKELKENLKDNGNGIFQSAGGMNFVLQTEVSLIYTDAGKGRRIHNIILAPDFDTVDEINSYLLTKGRLDYDGRPIFKITCPELVENLRKISDKIEVIPAHIWTPWFALFGSMSGFDSVEEAFQDQSKYIYALETGLSSDPAMNWRLSKLDRFSLVSFSDSHSFWPWRIGREATIFDIEPSYDSLIKALRTKKGLEMTIEVDPNYGKYHLDGHRNCKVRLYPEETKKLNNMCPVCKNPLTIGVLNRVEQLADRKMGFKPEGAVPFKSLIPIAEIISEITGNPVSGKKTWQELNKLIEKFGSELNVMLESSHEEIKRLTDEKIADAIIANREGKINIEPGYDGEYGYPVFNKEKIKKIEPVKINKIQKSLSEF